MGDYFFLTILYTHQWSNGVYRCTLSQTEQLQILANVPVEPQVIVVAYNKTEPRLRTIVNSDNVLRLQTLYKVRHRIGAKTARWRFAHRRLRL